MTDANLLPRAPGRSELDVALYRRARALFDAVVDWPAPERGRLIERCCGGDRALRELLEQLVEMDDRSDFTEELLTAHTPRLARSLLRGR
jgi:hypothetical protein